MGASATFDERAFREIFQRSPLSLYRIDSRGRVAAMNPAGLALLGFDEEAALVGRLFVDTVQEDDRPRVEERIRETLSSAQCQFEFRTVNGRVLSTSLIPILDDEGPVEGLFGISQDITERAQAEIALVNSEKRCRLLVECSPSCIHEIDDEGNLVSMNRAGLAMIGVDDESAIVGLSYMSFVSDEDSDRIRGLLEAAYRGQASWFEFRAVNGRRFRSSFVPMLEESGQVQRLMGLTEDVTERHEAEQKRRDLEAHLQQAQKMEGIGQLAGGIAHDFNNLLQVMRGHLALALDAVRWNLSPKEDLMKIDAAARRASELTKGLLAFGRRQATKTRVVDLNELTASFTGMLTRILPENISVRFTPEEKLPAIEADSSQLEQVILNLCLNARDAMDKGGELSLRTSTCADPEGGDAPWVELRVADTGTGMDAETLRHVFDPFFSTKGPQGGTGLGLSVAYGIVQQHRGRIALKSEPGEGTVVEVSFPASAARPLAEPAAVASEPAPSGNERILVVEDEAMVRSLVKNLLEINGYEVSVAEDGLAGVELFRELADRIDLVILDEVMPRMNGGDACRVIREIRPDVPVLFTSGYHSPDTLPESVPGSAGTEVLAKPYASETLLEKVRKVLDG